MGDSEFMNPAYTAPDEDQDGDINHESVAIEGVDKEEVENERERETLYFDQEGENYKIDYVLAYEDDNDEEKEEKRNAYEINLLNECLILETEEKELSQDGKTCFTKIHATWEALITGAELLSMRKKLKLNKDLSFKTKSGQYRIISKDIQEENQSCVGGCAECCDCFDVGPPVVPEEEDYFTAVFTKGQLRWFDCWDDDKDIDREKKRTFFTNAERSLIVKEILDRTPFTPKDAESQKYGLHKLIRRGIYSDAYPLHEGPIKPFIGESKAEAFAEDKRDRDRMRLYEAWVRPGRWYCSQPLDLVRKYFGEKIAIYFAWLGFYTTYLISASILGLAAFIYGCATILDDVPGKEICDLTLAGNTTMCPSCDTKCTYWILEKSCLYSRLTYLFDNYATVIFAFIMPIWGTLLLEMWKREEKKLGYDWDVAHFELDERMRPEFEFKVETVKKNPVTDEDEPYVPIYSRIPRSCTALTTVLFFICVVIAAIFGVIVYRMVISVLMIQIPVWWVQSWASLITSITASCINLIVIMILGYVYKIVAYWLTELERPRTDTQFEDAYTLKMYIFQFINYYGSLFYIAFFKGNFRGRPDTKTYYLFGAFKPEACDPAGCLIELSIQLFIIMTGKQVLNNFMELVLPWFKGFINKRKSKQAETEDNLYMRWEKDKDMAQVTHLGLFDEYLELAIQYGFITLFVACFPLAPLFALFNNIIEIRLDAYKFVCVWRRNPAWKAQDIGLWTQILDGVAAFSMITNAFIIGWTSDFVPKIYYMLKVNPDRTLDGFPLWQLSNFTTTDFPAGTAPDDPGPLGNLTNCMYKDFRHGGAYQDPYAYTQTFWEVLAVRLAFILCFEQGVRIARWIIASAVSDVPSSVKRLQVYERQLTKKLQYEAARANLDRTKNKTTAFKRGKTPLQEAAQKLATMNQFAMDATDEG